MSCVPHIRIPQDKGSDYSTGTGLKVIAILFLRHCSTYFAGYFTKLSRDGVTTDGVFIGNQIY
jgi:hypothetical protein